MSSQSTLLSSDSDLLVKVCGNDAVQHSLIHFRTRHRRPADVVDEGLVHCLRGSGRNGQLPRVYIHMLMHVHVIMNINDLPAADRCDLSHCYIALSSRPCHTHLAKIADCFVQLLGRAADLLCKLLLRQRLLQLRQRTCLPVAAAMVQLQVTDAARLYTEI